MPYANNDGLNIYYEVEGEGTPLVLAHGSTADLTFWRRYGYVDALKTHYQLILFDLRGHGRSDKPHDHASYAQNKFVEDVIAVLDDIGLDKTHYYGYSISALFGYLLAINHQERFLSLILMGMNPLTFPESGIESTEAAIKGYKLLASDPDAYIVEVEKAFNRSLTPTERERFLAQDGEAFVIGMEAALGWPILTGKDLSLISLPCLIMTGEQDLVAVGSEDIAKYITESQLVSLPGLNHMQSWQSSEITLPHIKEFLTRVNK